MIPLAVLERTSDVVAPLWRGEGLEPARYAGAFDGVYVDLAPKSFAWEQPLGRSVRLRPVALEAGAAPEWFGALEPPVVYVTMGTVHTDLAVFHSLLGGFDGDVSAVVTVGRQADPASLGPVPPRIRVESFVPQADVLPFCHAVVCHGGSGSVLGALAHGLPVVLLPMGADQPLNAERCAALGAGLVLDVIAATPEDVSEAVSTVLSDPSYRAAAERLRDEFAALPGPAHAVALLERLESGAMPVLA
jgi:MGT family glycosyltransferase